ncbi:MAG: hypothetical protein Q4B63_05780 [Clostridium perfringens]|nr:hypothetical protein [Clostridium perfringens]
MKNEDINKLKIKKREKSKKQEVCGINTYIYRLNLLKNQKKTKYDGKSNFINDNLTFIIETSNQTTYIQKN